MRTRSNDEFSEFSDLSRSEKSRHSFHVKIYSMTIIKRAMFIVRCKSQMFQRKILSCTRKTLEDVNSFFSCSHIIVISWFLSSFILYLYILYIYSFCYGHKCFNSCLYNSRQGLGWLKWIITFIRTRKPSHFCFLNRTGISLYDIQIYVQYHDLIFSYPILFVSSTF